MNLRLSAVCRRCFVILLPLLLASCQSEMTPKPQPQQPAAAEPPPVLAPQPSKPAPAKKVMTRFRVALANPAGANDGAHGAAASLSARIDSCWRAPAAPDAPEVTLRLALNQDGTVKTITALDKKAFTTNAVYRATASAATTAFFTCGPFVLPVSSYATWKTLDLRLTPHH
jgi:hypothetical protein